MFIQTSTTKKLVEEAEEFVKRVFANAIEHRDDGRWDSMYCTDRK